MVVTLEGYGRDAEAGAPTAAVMYRLLTAVNDKVRADALRAGAPACMECTPAVG